MVSHHNTGYLLIQKLSEQEITKPESCIFRAVVSSKIWETLAPVFIPNIQCRSLSLTHDTTRPLKHGNLAPSSEISSFTTLKHTEDQWASRGINCCSFITSQEFVWFVDGTAEWSEGWKHQRGFSLVIKKKKSDCCGAKRFTLPTHTGLQQKHSSPESNARLNTNRLAENMFGQVSSLAFYLLHVLSM